MERPKLYRVIVPVSDIELATNFYGCIFDIKGERVSAGRHYFDCGGIIFACYEPEADGDCLGTGWLYHENQYFYFSVDSLEQVYPRIESAGGKVLTPIKEMPWGERLFYAQDPFGSRLCFVDEDTVFSGST